MLSVAKSMSQRAQAPVPVAVSRVSLEKLFDDVHEDVVALHEVLRVAQITVCFGSVPREEVFRERLGILLGRAWSKDWLQVVSKKVRVYKPKVKQAGAHTSVHKILQEARRRQETKNSSQGSQ